MNLTINKMDVFLSKSVLRIYVKNGNDNTAIRSIGRDFSDLTGIPVSPDGYLYWNFFGSTTEALEVDSSNNPHMTTCYLAHILEKELGRLQSLSLSRSFINEVVAYVPDGTENNPKFKIYMRFAMKFYYERESKKYSLGISYIGRSVLIAMPLSQFPDLPRTSLSRVKVGNKFLQYDRLSDAEKQAEDRIYIVANRLSKPYTGIGFHDVLYRKSANPYKEYYDKVSWFSKKYLVGKRLDDVAKISEDGFIRLPKGRILTTSRGSNLLKFGQEQTNLNVYNGIKQYGPLYIPDTRSMRFIFIFHEKDRDKANHLYSYLNRGLKGFPGLESFVGLPFNLETLDKERSISYSSDLPSEEIKRKIATLNFPDSYKYVAIYISRISKHEEEEMLWSQYFKIKEALLARNISSQVVHAENIELPSFNYFLPNIAIALLAKLGGKPWKLARLIHEDLIVGIGAYRSSTSTFIGNAICFANDGSFEEFDAFEKNGIAALGQAFESTLQRFVKSNRKAERLIIHFYKDMNNAEEKYLLKEFENLHINLPYAVLRLTDCGESDLVAFDEDFEGKMPVSGTMIQISPRDFLLCNNARYEEKTAARIDEYPLPMRVKLSRFKGFDASHSDNMSELVHQVYQFSRMYWRTVKQKGNPVTIGYSQMVAKMIAHFEDRQLPNTDVARRSLWFL